MASGHKKGLLLVLTAMGLGLFALLEYRKRRNNEIEEMSYKVGTGIVRTFPHTLGDTGRYTYAAGPILQQSYLE